MDAAAQIQHNRLISLVEASVARLGIDAHVCARMESGSRVVLFAVASHDGRSAEISTNFVFDGDAVLLRGFGKAASDLAAMINQVRHQGLVVA